MKLKFKIQWICSFSIYLFIQSIKLTYREIKNNNNMKMNPEEEIKILKEKVSKLLDQFNEEYSEFLENDEKIKAFRDVFKSLDLLEDTLKKLHYQRQCNL